MLYTIAGTITFNSADGTLTRLQDNDVVKLSIPASRLLEVLLNAPNGFVDRESLLTDVWDKHGLRGSHGNLNQYVSMLRRMLSSLGCDDLIITVPKMGFRLNPVIPVSQPSRIPLPAVSHEDTLSWEHCVSVFVLWLRRSAPLILLSGLTLLLAGLVWPKQSEWSERETAPVSDKLNAQCDVLYVQNIGANDRLRMNKQVAQILAENQLVCGSDRLVLVDSNTSEVTTSLGRTLVSFCRTGADKRVVDCQNFYYYDRRTQ